MAQWTGTTGADTWLGSADNSGNHFLRGGDGGRGMDGGGMRGQGGPMAWPTNLFPAAILPRRYRRTGCGRKPRNP